VHEFVKTSKGAPLQKRLKSTAVVDISQCNLHLLAWLSQKIFKCTQLLVRQSRFNLNSTLSKVRLYLQTCQFNLFTS